MLALRSQLDYKSIAKLRDISPDTSTSSIHSTFQSSRFVDLFEASSLSAPKHYSKLQGILRVPQLTQTQTLSRYDSQGSKLKSSRHVTFNKDTHFDRSSSMNQFGSGQKNLHKRLQTQQQFIVSQKQLTVQLIRRQLQIQPQQLKLEQ